MHKIKLPLNINEMNGKAIKIVATIGSQIQNIPSRWQREFFANFSFNE